MHMGVDPIDERLRPTRAGESEARSALRISPVSRSTTTGTPSPA
jgi:hypothetical protein